jgi:tetratricopeptide (TPR) repeat protein
MSKEFCAMRARHIFLVVPLLVCAPAVAAAQSIDPAAGQGRRQQGLTLKEQGRCNEAIPYLSESLKLDRQLDTLLELADCEENVGMLGAASAHFLEARDRARSLGLETQRTIAEQRWQAVDARVAPRGWGAAPPPGDASPWNGQRIAGFALIGVGAASVTMGAIFGLKVSEKNRAIDSICPTGDPCPPSSVVDYNNAVAEAKIDRAASLIGFGVGAFFVGTGALLVLTAPKRHVSGMSLWLSPAIGSLGPGAAFSGTW